MIVKISQYKLFCIQYDINPLNKISNSNHPPLLLSLVLDLIKSVLIKKCGAFKYLNFIKLYVNVCMCAFNLKKIPCYIAFPKPCKNAHARKLTICEIHCMSFLLTVGVQIYCKYISR